MADTTMLPTPAPSTEPKAKRGSLSTGQIDASFELPPAAITANPNHIAASASSPSLSSPSSASDSSYRPISPPTATATKNAASVTRPSAGTRRRSSAATQQAPSSAAAAQQAEYTLPPPPTRSRKIIQMKPRTEKEPAEGAIAARSQIVNPTAAQPSSKTPSASASSSVTPSGTTATKRKQSSSGGPTTAAGRKIARKTAHSLIERRRRSKMNEEFAVLKDMIPACNGQDMHKLQVLSASIEYMRYLEQCLSDLKAMHAQCPSQQSQGKATTYPDQSYYSNGQGPPSVVSIPRTTSPTSSIHSSLSGGDVDMVDSTSHAASSHQAHQPGPSQPHVPHHHLPSISPAILPSSQTSPAISARHAHYHQGTYFYPSSSHSRPHSTTTSPTFGPSTQPPAGPGTYSTFRLSSPAVQQGSSEGKAPALDDREATAALLMLNVDRRSWSGAAGEARGRGMSVRDLLSS